MKYLVTGGAGMVGSHCAEYFARDKKNKVIVLDNLMRSSLFGCKKESVEYNWKYLAKYKNITHILGDVRNAQTVKRAIGTGVDVVIHAAGQPGVQFSIDNPLIDFDINAFGTLTVLEAVRECKPTFIFCSTNKVYGGNLLGSYPVDEKTSIDLTGHTPYGVSKLVADLYVQEYAQCYKMKTGVFRMSCIYGTRQFGFEDQGWVMWFIIASLLKKKITIFGDGFQARDILYVTDLVRAFDLFIKSSCKSDVFNIGGGEKNRISLTQLLTLIKSHADIKPKVGYAEWRQFDQKKYISNIDKINSVLTWQPVIGVDEGICQLINWVRENKEIL